MVIVRGGQKAQDNNSFLKATPLVWAIEGQNNESYRGFWTFPTKGGRVWRGCDGFPYFTFFRFLADLLKKTNFKSIKKHSVHCLTQGKVRPNTICDPTQILNYRVQSSVYLLFVLSVTQHFLSQLPSSPVHVSSWDTCVIGHGPSHPLTIYI